MSESQAFGHQNYWTVPDVGSYQFVLPPRPIAPDSGEFVAEMANAKLAFNRAGVRRVILVHGTMVGTDALGWYGHWQRVFPGWSKKLKHTYKSVVDRLSRDRGNFSWAYAEQLSRGLNFEEPSTRIEVERFEWTSENHHLGRADAAVRLADKLLDCRAADERVLLLGHSHAGNVFAIVTNLIGDVARSQPELLKRFFEASRHFSHWTRRIDVAVWRRLESRLGKRASAQDGESDDPMGLDFVTFGTPVRYGWDESGFDNLLHFVNHHPEGDVEPFRCVWPQTRTELIKAIKGEYGDFVQQSFIAGSDFPLGVWSWSAWKSNRMLRDLLEGEEWKTKRLDRLRQGTRVAKSGMNLLVDYASVDPTAREICGHVVYTDLDWMAFHLKEIRSRIYSQKS